MAKKPKQPESQDPQVPEGFVDVGEMLNPTGEAQELAQPSSEIDELRRRVNAMAALILEHFGKVI